MTVIHHTEVLGPIKSYYFFTKADQLIMENFENYQKRSTRNRYQILSTNGILQLTCPLIKGKNQQQLISDVKLSYDMDWPSQHLQAIKSAYGKSPYFEYYFDALYHVFLKKNTFLLDFNDDLMAFMIAKIKLKTNLSKSQNYMQNYSSDVLDLRQDIQNLTLNHKPYTQVWQEKFGFIPNLSILDLLFCCGPESLQILQFTSEK